MPGNPQLADQEDVQGGSQRPGHFVRDRYSSSGQREDDYRVKTRVMFQKRRQLPPRFAAVGERLLMARDHILTVMHGDCHHSRWDTASISLGARLKQ